MPTTMKHRTYTAEHYRPTKPLPRIDTDMLPPGSTIRHVQWKPTEASWPGSFLPMPALPPGHQLVVTLPDNSPLFDAQDYLRTLGFKTWGSGGLIWLGDVVAATG